MSVIVERIIRILEEEDVPSHIAERAAVRAFAEIYKAEAALVKSDQEAIRLWRRRAKRYRKETTTAKPMDQLRHEEIKLLQWARDPLSGWERNEDWPYTYQLRKG